MNNKKSLILLALILFLALIFLIAYAFSISNKKEEPLPKVPLETKEKEVEKKEVRDPNLEKIKTQMEKLNNQSLEVKEEATDENSGELEAAKEYEEEFIKKEQAQMADGLVTEKTNSYLKVKFSSVSYTWVSKVNINSKTSITKLNPGSENITISLDEIDLDSKVVVRTTGASITEEEFEAESVIKVN
jgi:uncharacterized protein YpmS